jgi:uncharacterized protein (TIGR02145 family)
MREILTVVVMLFFVTSLISQDESFTDSRDGLVYKTVILAGETWMAENLKYKTDNSWCYKELDLNCDAFGRLYTWEAALDACPEGWTLPGDGDFKSLITFYKDDKKLAFAALVAGGVSGFETLMAGWRTCDGEFMELLQDASFWSSVERKKKYGNYLEFRSDGAYVFMSYGYKCAAKQVRCIKKD